MVRKLTGIGFAILAVVLACLLPPAARAQQQRVDFRPPADKPIAKIAVLAIVPSQQVRVNNLNAAGTAFGILPALVYGSENDRKSREYVAEMNKRKATLAPQLANLLHRELVRKYQVVWLRERARQKEDKSPDYSHIQTDADAILSVFYGQVGYLSPYTEEDYSPLLHLGVRLLDARTRETLYYKQLAVHPRAERLSKTFDAAMPDARYRYRTFDALMADFERSIEGLLLSQETLALRIVRDLDVPDRLAESAPAAAPKEAQAESQAPVEPATVEQEAP
jgi:hypothetical protein